MAVIQDLPLELLRRILELTLDPYAEFHETFDSYSRFQAAPGERQLILCRAALVARAWFAPAVELMTHELVISMHYNNRAQAVLAHLQSRVAVDALMVERLRILLPTAQALTVLGNTVRGLTSLNLLGNEMNVQLIPPPLLTSEHPFSFQVGQRSLI
jgi:hypothetical protein